MFAVFLLSEVLVTDSDIKRIMLGDARPVDFLEPVPTSNIESHFPDARIHGEYVIICLKH